MLTKQTKILYAVLFLAIYTCAANAAYDVKATLHFNNDTDQQVVKTMEPYLDNYSHYAVDSTYQFSAPKDKINAHEFSTAQTSYTSKWGWYGMSQYAYNYAGRSPNYGCFITEVRLNGNFWQPDHNIVIASYRQDPAHTDDYLMCTVDRNANTEFTVRFKSAKGSTDNKPDDTKRYSIDDKSSALKYTSYYSINKPIPLWTDPEKKQTLVINPDTSEPVLVASDSLLATTPKARMRVITVINYTKKTLVAGSPLLDKFSRLNKNYYVNQPSEIKPGTLQKISVAASEAGYFSFARFNYHIQGSSTEQRDGCYITAISDNYDSIDSLSSPDLVVSSLAASSNAPEQKLFCTISPNLDEVIFYDNLTEGWDNLRICLDPYNCISYNSTFNAYPSFPPKSPQKLNFTVCGSGLSFDFPIDPINTYTMRHVHCNRRGFN